MARARNIKPGFFTNDLLAECQPLARLLFQGLWCHADRDGRLEDRPKKFKAEILPYDDCDADALLSELESNGFVERYDIDGKRYLQVVNFCKHQNPHIKEPESTIPAPCKHSARKVQAPCENGSSPADSLIPHPDSGFPSKSLPDKPAKKEKKRSVALAEDFEPNETGIAYAAKRQVSLPEELAAFRNWHTAKGTTMKDWQAAWRTWCDKAVEFGRSGPSPNARASPRQGLHESRAKTIAVLTGREKNEHTSNAERDITGESVRVA